MNRVELNDYLSTITTGLECSKCKMIYYARKLWKIDSKTGNFEVVDYNV